MDLWAAVAAGDDWVMSESLDSIYRKVLVALLDDLAKAKLADPFFIVDLGAALEGDPIQEIDINLLANYAAAEIRNLSTKITFLERRLRKCAEIMECNDPGNFKEIFGVKS